MNTIFIVRVFAVIFIAFLLSRNVAAQSESPASLFKTGTINVRRDASNQVIGIKLVIASYDIQLDDAGKRLAAMDGQKVRVSGIIIQKGNNKILRIDSSQSADGPAIKSGVIEVTKGTKNQFVAIRLLVSSYDIQLDDIGKKLAVMDGQKVRVSGTCSMIGGKQILTVKSIELITAGTDRGATTNSQSETKDISAGLTNLENNTPQSINKSDNSVINASHASTRNKETITDGLVLSPSWNNKMAKGSLILDDLRKLLIQYGEPNVDCSPHPYTVIMPGVCYLMPMNDALNIMKLPNRVASRNTVVCPGFPDKSFYYNSFSGDYGEGYSTMLLVTDAKNQIVAVQFVNNNPTNTNINNIKAASISWHIFNIIQTRVKADAKAKIAFNVKQEYCPSDTANISSVTYRIDSEFYDSRGAIKEKNVLYMPQPIINLILYIIKYNQDDQLGNERHDTEGNQ